jgi:sugar transferase EpsL
MELISGSCMAMNLTVKRLTDILVASGILFLFGPVMILASIGIYLSMGRPVPFRQQRPGLEGRIFTLMKFHTMHDVRDQEGRLLPNERRVTPLGRILRHTSLDELP